MQDIDDDSTFKCLFCADLESKEACLSDDAASMDCKWLGGEKDGFCMRTDPCHAITDSRECSKDKRCDYFKMHEGTGVTCFQKKVGKRECKLLGKVRKTDSEQTAMDKMIACRSEVNCEWMSGSKNCQLKKNDN